MSALDGITLARIARSLESLAASAHVNARVAVWNANNWTTGNDDEFKMPDDMAEKLHAVLDENKPENQK